MRVIAGSARGVPLKAPQRAGTRPTSDKVREALFSILASMGVQPARVLDCYAGSGALGIEALSRGAERAVFIDQAAEACAVIRANLNHTKLVARAEVIRGEIEKVLPKLGGPFDLVLFDPPYAESRAAAVLAQLAISGMINEDSVVVYEHGKRSVPPEQCGPLTLSQSRRYGDTVLSIYE